MAYNHKCSLEAEEDEQQSALEAIEEMRPETVSSRKRRQFAAGEWIDVSAGDKLTFRAPTTAQANAFGMHMMKKKRK